MSKLKKSVTICFFFREASTTNYVKEARTQQDNTVKKTDERINGKKKRTPVIQKRTIATATNDTQLTNTKKK